MTNEILIFITEIAIPLIFSSISIYVLPNIKDFVNEKQLNQAVKIAVEGVEQYMSTAEGLDKKQMAKDYIQSKFYIDDNQLDILIEATVFEMKNK